MRFGICDDAATSNYFVAATAAVDGVIKAVVPGNRDCVCLAAALPSLSLDFLTALSLSYRDAVPDARAAAAGSATVDLSFGVMKDDNGEDNVLVCVKGPFNLESGMLSLSLSSSSAERDTPVVERK